MHKRGIHLKLKLHIEQYRISQSLIFDPNGVLLITYKQNVVEVMLDSGVLSYLFLKPQKSSNSIIVSCGKSVLWCKPVARSDDHNIRILASSCAMVGCTLSTCKSNTQGLMHRQ